jgi:hypothetical protein
MKGYILRSCLIMVSILAIYCTLPTITRSSVSNASSSDWFISTIGSIDWGYYVHYSYTSISVDSQGIAHISYRGPNHELQYANNVTNCFSPVVVHTSDDRVARENALAIGSNKRLAISFSNSDGGDEDLMYAEKVGIEWKITTIDGLGSVGMESDIVIDRNGKNHISHWQWNGRNVRYTTNKSGVWQTEDVDTPVDWNRTAIAVGSDDQVHIVYGKTSGLTHASSANGTWQKTTIDTSGGSPSMAIDSNNKLHVSYTTSSALKYATNISGTWITTVITNVMNIGSDHAIAVDKNNKVHISYHEPAKGYLLYANNILDSWSTVIIDSNEYVGRSNSIAVDTNNNIHISYRDDNASPRRLRAAWGNSIKDFFAVGDGETILHFDGSQWHRMFSGSIYNSLTDIWGTSSTDVFAVGSSQILHYDGSIWSKIYTDGGSLSGVWGNSSSDVYAVGSDYQNGNSYGIMLHYDGQEWNRVITTTSILNEVWSNSPTNIYAVGDDGLVLHFDGHMWEPMTSTGITKDLNSVWGSSSTDVFVVGDGGTISHFDGRTWSHMVSGLVYDDLVSIWGSSPTNIFAVSMYGEVLHYDGRTWKKLDTDETTTSLSLYGVWGTSPSSIFILGGGSHDYGQIVHYAGDSWSALFSAKLKYATNTQQRTCYRIYQPIIQSSQTK